MKTYKALGALLAYPEAELIAALDEIESALAADGLLRKDELAGLRRLAEVLRHGDLMTMQERYIQLFDRVRSLSLHLFEHVHGESRDRGQAMVDLAALYAQQGLTLADHELPDFLPAFLEYLSLLTHKDAAEQLKDTAHILDGIGARLAKRGSHYAAVFNALLALAGHRGAHAVIDDAEIRREDDPAEIDKLWAEQPAFGGHADGAPGQAAMSVIHFDKTRSYQRVQKGAAR
jgi:nitrate reductase molybdenum cofactor assembly chaperone NarJ/NarW